MALRFRQAKKRQRAVGLDLDQPLRQRAGARRSEAAVDHDDAREAVRVLPKVGGDRGQRRRPSPSS